MFLGPYKLFDIINLGTIKKLQVTKISYDLDFKLNHTMKSKEYDIENNTLDICKRNNEVQFITLTKYIEKVRGYLKANPNSTKRKNQLEYLSNTLDHFVIWYEDNKFQIPDKIPLLEWSKGSFSANKNFSIIKIKNKSYSLRRNQPPAQSKSKESSSFLFVGCWVDLEMIDHIIPQHQDSLTYLQKAQCTLFKNTLIISMVLFTSYVTSQSVTYEGERNQEGKYHGQGVITYSNGEKWEGEFKDGKLHPQIKTRSERVI